MERLNSMPTPQLEGLLMQACSSREWARRVARTRPFADAADLLATADEVWMNASPKDWREALDGHPRIGESGGSSADFSSREQAGMSEVDAKTQAAIQDGNRAYEDRFGHVFLISAAGRTPAQILANLRARMDNVPAEELEIAAEEHRRITRMRLQELLL